MNTPSEEPAGSREARARAEYAHLGIRGEDSTFVRRSSSYGGRTPPAGPPSCSPGRRAFLHVPMLVALQVGFLGLAGLVALGEQVALRGPEGGFVAAPAAEDEGDGHGERGTRDRPGDVDPVAGEGPG